jgi:DNA-binding transcriptional MerR regulator
MGEIENLSLEQLAEAAGMTTRNVRAYQTRGLIPSPVRDGRCARYGARHLRLLLSIRRARERGATLGLISDHLASGGSLDGTALSDRWLVGKERHRRSGDPPGSWRDLEQVLPGLPEAEPADCAPAFERLVESGLFRREGSRVLVAADLAGALSALQRAGAQATMTLQVAAHTMETIERTADELKERLKDLPETTAGLAVDLVVIVARGILSNRIILSEAV